MFDYVHAKGLSIHDGHVFWNVLFFKFFHFFGWLPLPLLHMPVFSEKNFYCKNKQIKSPTKTKNQERVEVKLLTFNIYFSELTEYNSLQNKAVEGERGFLGSWCFLGTLLDSLAPEAGNWKSSNPRKIWM